MTTQRALMIAATALMLAGVVGCEKKATSLAGVAKRAETTPPATAPAGVSPTNPEGPPAEVQGATPGSEVPASDTVYTSADLSILADARFAAAARFEVGAARDISAFADVAGERLSEVREISIAFAEGGGADTSELSYQIEFLVKDPGVPGSIVLALFPKDGTIVELIKDLVVTPIGDGRLRVVARLTQSHAQVGIFFLRGIDLSASANPGEPSLTIESPAANAFVNATSASAFEIHGTCGPSGVSVSMTAPISNTLTCENGTWATVLDLAAAVDGAVAVDMAVAAGSKLVTAHRSFTKDTRAPVIEEFALAGVAADGVLSAADLAAVAAPLVAFATEVGATTAFSGFVSPPPNPCGPDVASYAGTAPPGGDGAPATDGSYGICVRVMDAAGNVAFGTLAAPVTFDRLPPMEVDLLAASTGAGYGEVQGSVTVPATPTEIAAIRLFRSAPQPATGVAAPTCTAGPAQAGEKLVQEWTPPFGASPFPFVDQTEVFAQRVSYRVCTMDAAGNISEGRVVLDVLSKPMRHEIFLTSSDFTLPFTAAQPSLGLNAAFDTGFSGADARCSSLASNAGRAGRWRALIGSVEARSVGTRLMKSGHLLGPKTRLPVRGEVATTIGGIVATSALDLWDGAIGTTIDLNESGAAVTSGQVWTGALATGSADPTGTCGGFGPEGGANGRRGARLMTSSQWIASTTANCNNTGRLYCMSVVDVASPELVASQGPADGEVALDVTLPAVPNFYGRLELRRANSGSVAPLPSCDDAADVVVETFDGPFAGGAALKVVDPTGSSGRLFSYRACVYDLAEELVTSAFVVAAPSKGPLHRIFVTNELYDGKLSAAYGGQQFASGRAGADFRCQAQANEMSQPGVWRAFLSISTEDALDRIQANANYYTVDGRFLGAGAAAICELGAGVLPHAPNVDQSGAEPAAFEAAWTGSDVHCVRAAATCSDWTSNLVTGTIGRPDRITSEWSLSGTAANCSILRRLYCFSE